MSEETSAGRVAFMKHLLSLNVNLGGVDGHKRTVLHLACEMGDQPLVSLLLERRSELLTLRQEKKGTKVRLWHRGCCCCYVTPIQPGASLTRIVAAVGHCLPLCS